MPVEVLSEEEMCCSVEVRVFLFWGGGGVNRKEREKGGNAK